jgi:hypothetical protein
MVSIIKKFDPEYRDPMTKGLGFLANRSRLWSIKNRI